MSRDDYDNRRRMSNAFLDRRQDRVDAFRDQQRLTRDVYEAQRAGDHAKVRSTLGVSPSSVDEIEPEHADIHRRRLRVWEEIDALTAFSAEARNEWRIHFDAINLVGSIASDSLGQFRSRVKERATVLTNISVLLRLSIGPLFMGFSAIAHRIQSLSFLNGALQQRWVDEIERIAATHTNPPALDLSFFPLGRANAMTQAMNKVIGEIDSAAGMCESLSAALLLLSSSCVLYRSKLHSL